MGISRTQQKVALGALGLGLFVVAIVVGGNTSSTSELSVVAAVVLGLVEGLTEYLPISSTGHLLVAQELMGLGGTEEADLALETYAICIQAGAILAVIVLYRERLWQMTEGLVGRDEAGRQLLIATMLAFGPTVAIALVFQDFVRDRLFGAGPIAIAWFVGGVAILVLVRSGRFDRAGAEITSITSRQAVTIGVVQALALWPGVSRSLTTIVAAVLVGLSLKAAVEFSFLLGLLTLGAATAYEALNSGDNLIDTYGILTPAIGVIVAFISAVAAVRWMIAWLENKGFEVFGWYRIAAGLALGVAVVADWI